MKENIKIRIHGIEHNKQVQDELFRLGYHWAMGGTDYKYLDSQYLYAYGYKNDSSRISRDFSNSVTYFIEHENKEVTLEDLQKLNNKTSQTMKTTSQKPVKLTRTRTISVGGQERDITITSLFDGDQVRTGYAVRNTMDEPNKELAVDISTGRAMSNKTNMTPNLVILNEHDRYLLYAVVDNMFNEIKRGKVEIKGIK